MKQKHVNAARELRLWISTIVVPIAVIAYTKPEFINVLVAKCKEGKRRIKKAFGRD